ncbi:hypothetical protein M9H77_29450 [Catharanthus roseus]|uniref:Uncharacterized protein n=1 Tax=Catharanthus roseus TaxID=4058 RepID=A0ACB9ZWM6_CATRO|nr:hypothetical protein M9H77_29450 [Catharanthus roseus]
MSIQGLIVLRSIQNEIERFVKTKKDDKGIVSQDEEGVEQNDNDNTYEEMEKERDRKDLDNEEKINRDGGYNLNEKTKIKENGEDIETNNEAANEDENKESSTESLEDEITYQEDDIMDFDLRTTRFISMRLASRKKVNHIGKTREEHVEIKGDMMITKISMAEDRFDKFENEDMLKTNQNEVLWSEKVDKTEKNTQEAKRSWKLITIRIQMAYGSMTMEDHIHHICSNSYHLRLPHLRHRHPYPSHPLPQPCHPLLESRHPGPVLSHTHPFPPPNQALLRHGNTKESIDWALNTPRSYMMGPPGLV